jgi:hypothetical protein
LAQAEPSSRQCFVDARTYKPVPAPKSAAGRAQSMSVPCRAPAGRTAGLPRLFASSDVPPLVAKDAVLPPPPAWWVSAGGLVTFRRASLCRLRPDLLQQCRSARQPDRHDAQSYWLPGDQSGHPIFGCRAPGADFHHFVVLGAGHQFRRELHLLSPAAGSPSTEAPEPAASKAPSPIILLAQTWRRPAWRSYATAAEDPTPPYSLREAGCRIRALYLWVEDAENTLRGGTSCLNK